MAPAAHAWPLDTDAESAAMWEHLAGKAADQIGNERAYIAKCVHTELFDCEAGPQPSWFAPSFARAFGEGGGSDAALREIVTEVAAGVYTFDMLSPTFCAKLLEELQARYRCVRRHDVASRMTPHMGSTRVIMHL